MSKKGKCIKFVKYRHESERTIDLPPLLFIPYLLFFFLCSLSLFLLLVVMIRWSHKVVLLTGPVLTRCLTFYTCLHYVPTGISCFNCSYTYLLGVAYLVIVLAHCSCTLPESYPSVTSCSSSDTLPLNNPQSPPCLLYFDELHSAVLGTCFWLSAPWSFLTGLRTNHIGCQRLN